MSKKLDKIKTQKKILDKNNSLQKIKMILLNLEKTIYGAMFFIFLNLDWDKIALCAT